MVKQKSILKLVNADKLLTRFLFFFFSVVFVALNYNFILVPNKLVIGGMSGLGIVINKLTGLSTSVFLFISTGILTVLGLIFLNKKMVLKILFGSLLYNTIVALTEPLRTSISIQFESTLLLLIFTSFIYGVSNGIAYRSGFIIGGSDTIAAIISKYTKLPMGSSSIWTNIFIIFLGFIVFGFTQTIYSVFILLLSSKIVNIIILGVKDSKMCYIKSNKPKEILDILLNEVHIGVTEFAGKGGLFNKNEPMLLVIVPFDQYYGFKHLVKNIDQNACIITSDCHDVSGGYKKQFLPF